MRSIARAHVEEHETRLKGLKGGRERSDAKVRPPALPNSLIIIPLIIMRVCVESSSWIPEESIDLRIENTSWTRAWEPPLNFFSWI